MEEVKNYYSSYHQTQETPARVGDLVEAHANIVAYLLDRLKHCPEPTFLDYGFGAGAFLKQVVKQGYWAAGVDFSDQNCEQMLRYYERESHAFPIVNLAKESLDKLQGQRFSCITLFQVIEHLIDPLDTLRQLAALQSSGDILYIECPNNDALFLKIKNLIRNYVGRQGFFDSLKPPEHIYGFNRRSLALLLTSLGYEPIDVSDYPFGNGLNQVETCYWYPNLFQVLTSTKPKSLYKISKSLIGTLDPLASKWFGLGGGLYALAQKK
jgi:2-polyprenyl-3-methyl-5-hydroxy-6-metoxy-1,4-benzoquinol methylase